MPLAKSRIHAGVWGRPQAPAKRTSNEFYVRFISLLLSSTVSTTYAEPIHPRALYGAVPPDYGRLDEIGLRVSMINGWSFLSMSAAFAFASSRGNPAAIPGRL